MVIVAAGRGVGERIPADVLDLAHHQKHPITIDQVKDLSFCKLQILQCLRYRECQDAVAPCALLPAQSSARQQRLRTLRPLAFMTGTRYEKTRRTIC